MSGWYQIECWGARGGHDGNDKGGFGAYTKGSFELQAGQTLYVMVGNYVDNMNKNSKAPWNGGGSCRGPESSGSGGGATDVRLSADSAGSTNWSNGLGTRIIVAGGGGGAGHQRSPGRCGGNAGVPNGQNGYSSAGGNGSGATLTSGYSLGQGQNASTDAGAGGSGYYGGKAGKNVANNKDGAGGGGSSYISGYGPCPVYNGMTARNAAWSNDWNGIGKARIICIEKK